MKPLRTAHPKVPKQSGAVFIVMLVILVVGVAAVLITSLSLSSLNNLRRDNTASALAQAKEALIGRAVSASNHPGSLPCPDLTGDGIAEVATNCTSYIGRLPWKTLGISELRDGDGEVLWYALSTTLHNNTGQPINSDTPGLLATIGNISQNSVAAIVFAPGAPLCGHSHLGNNVVDYLEAVSSVVATSAVVSTSSNNCSGTPYNDNLIAITTEQLFQPVEKRIAREVKICLDEYAAAPVPANSNLPSWKYPWAATISPTSYLGSFSTLFGRIPYQQPPSTSTTAPSSAASTLASALSALQTALNDFASNNNSTTQNALNSAGAYVESLHNSIPAIAGTIDTAGEWGSEFALGSHTLSGVQGKIDAANAALTPYSSPSPDTTMLSDWPPSCTTLFSSQYWPDWKELVFYQVASGYKPGTTPPLSCGTTCLSVTGSGANAGGSGTYHAVVLVAGKQLGVSRITTSIADYLEPNNLLPSGDPTKPYTVFRPIDTGFQTVNDLAQCLDGNGGYCK